MQPSSGPCSARSTQRGRRLRSSAREHGTRDGICRKRKRVESGLGFPVRWPHIRLATRHVTPAAKRLLSTRFLLNMCVSPAEIAQLVYFAPRTSQDNFFSRSVRALAPRHFRQETRRGPCDRCHQAQASSWVRDRAESALPLPAMPSLVRPTSSAGDRRVSPDQTGPALGILGR